MLPNTRKSTALFEGSHDRWLVLLIRGVLDDNGYGLILTAEKRGLRQNPVSVPFSLPTQAFAVRHRQLTAWTTQNYIQNSVPTSYRTKPMSSINTEQLMLCTEIIAVTVKINETQIRCLPRRSSSYYSSWYVHTRSKHVIKKITAAKMLQASNTIGHFTWRPKYVYIFFFRMGKQNHSTVRIFSGVRANPRKAPIRFVMSVRPSFRPQVIPTGRIFVKFYTGNVYENVARNSKFV
jgi:hypothetical protein